MNDSKKALLIFGGLAAVVVIVVGVMMSKTAFGWSDCSRFWASS